MYKLCVYKNRVWVGFLVVRALDENQAWLKLRLYLENNPRYGDIATWELVEANSEMVEDVWSVNPW